MESTLSLYLHHSPFMSHCLEPFEHIMSLTTFIRTNRRARTPSAHSADKPFVRRTPDGRLYSSRCFDHCAPQCRRCHLTTSSDSFMIILSLSFIASFPVADNVNILWIHQRSIGPLKTSGPTGRSFDPWFVIRTNFASHMSFRFGFTGLASTCSRRDSSDRHGL